jgi:hypothetical protein
MPCELQALWIGPRLGWIERLCFQSMLAHGHKLVLWTYAAVERVTEGIEVRSAEDILSSRYIVRDSTTDSVGSPFGDRFRYRLLQLNPGGTWVDADILMLRPIESSAPYLFGRESDELINGAVLRLPPSSRALRDLLRLTSSRVPVPHWWPAAQRRKQRWDGLLGRHQKAQDMPWGTMGPYALTATLRRYGLEGEAQLVAAFYPIHWNETSLFFEPPEAVEAKICPDTFAVHLWNNVLGDRRREPPPPRSWLAEMCERYGVSLPS